MPLVQTRGAASAQGFGEFAQATVPNYIEDVFSTYLYTGNGSTQTITNGIDLAGKGGLTILKNRSNGSYPCFWWDSARGNYVLLSDRTDAQYNYAGDLVSFNSNGFSLGSPTNTLGINYNNYSQVSWTFRKQPKFFDVVTYTGTGTARTIAHNLGSVPGSIFVKSTSGVGSWVVYHRGVNGGTNPQNYAMTLNATAAQYALTNFWNDTAPTSSVFTVGAVGGETNETGVTYVAYLFAHNAGGFGLTGTDNVISCGSCLGSSVNNLGFEPQWVLVKSATSAQNWYVFDNMRGLTASNPATYDETGAYLWPNSSAAEATFSNGLCSITATGFDLDISSSQTYIYIAIRRGPMKVPTSGTSVFGLNYRNGSGAIATVTGGAGVSDAVLVKNVGATVASLFSSRLTNTGYLVTSSTAAEVAAGATILQASPWDVMDGVKLGTTSTITNATSNTYINYFFDRAPSFCDVVCYTGTGSATTIAHNLGVVPELIIAKCRSGAGTVWPVYTSATGNGFELQLDNTSASGGNNTWNYTTPTASVFSISGNSSIGTSSATYVAWLFATCAGVSKVGSYTGNATLTTIDCGFTTGARFVLIKITNTTGNWFVFDTARGMTVGTNPSLTLNSTSAENPGSNISTTSVGFTLAASPSYPVNSNGYNYIFLAIA